MLRRLPEQVSRNGRLSAESQTLPWEKYTVDSGRKTTLGMRPSCYLGGSLSAVGMSGEIADTDLVDYIPRCYRSDRLTKNILGWQTCFEDGGPKVTKRRFPVMYFSKDRYMPRVRLPLPFIESTTEGESRGMYRRQDNFDNWTIAVVDGGEVPLVYSARGDSGSARATRAGGGPVQSSPSAVRGAAGPPTTRSPSRQSSDRVPA